MRAERGINAEQPEPGGSVGRRATPRARSALCAHFWSLSRCIFRRRIAKSRFTLRGPFSCRPDRASPNRSPLTLSRRMRFPRAMSVQSRFRQASPARNEVVVNHFTKYLDRIVSQRDRPLCMLPSRDFCNTLGCNEIAWGVCFLVTPSALWP